MKVVDADPISHTSEQNRVAPARISVVIPLYDKAPFIEAAIRSTLDNGPGIHEVIVIDDGSRDNGPEIVAAIADPRIKLIRKTNGGVSSARTLAWTTRAATGSRSSMPTTSGCPVLSTRSRP